MTLAKRRSRTRTTPSPSKPPPTAISRAAPSPSKPPPKAISRTAPSPSKPPPKAIAVLSGDALRAIFRLLPLADLLRAALVCHCWRRVVARCLPSTPPLLGYFFHPTNTPPRPPLPDPKVIFPVVFAPVDASTPRLSLDFAPDVSRFKLVDSHRGLLVFQPIGSAPHGILPRLLVLDPASRRHTLLPLPPRDMLPEDRWSVHYVGPALLSRAHPSKLCFEAVCFAIEDGHPRAWVASFKDDTCVWRALPKAMEVKVDFKHRCIESRCVHAAGNIYWHICNSGRLLVLDPATMKFSYLSVPAELGDHFFKFRIGEMPEDGRLCVMTVENEEMQLWVRGEGKWSDNGWLLKRKENLCEAFDAVLGLPRDTMSRIVGVWLSDIDAGRTGKLFIKTWGYGRYAFSLETSKLERLVMKGDKEHGHPIFAYVLAWPPAFLAP